MNYLYMFLLVLQAADLISTYIIFKNGGEERFYLTQYFTLKFGVIKGLLISKGLCIIIICILWILKIPIALVIIITLFYIGVITNNIIVLKRLKESTR